jgi:hypothetical protein
MFVRPDASSYALVRLASHICKVETQIQRRN